MRTPTKYVFRLMNDSLPRCAGLTRVAIYQFSDDAYDEWAAAAMTSLLAKQAHHVTHARDDGQWAWATDAAPMAKMERKNCVLCSF